MALGFRPWYLTLDRKWSAMFVPLFRLRGELDGGGGSELYTSPAQVHPGEDCSPTCRNGPGQAFQRPPNNEIKIFILALSGD